MLIWRRTEKMFETVKKFGDSPDPIIRNAAHTDSMMLSIRKSLAFFRHAFQAL
jgi:hypothetical protein